VFEVPETIEQGAAHYRARYEDLRARAASRQAASRAPAPRPDAAGGVVLQSQVIPAGWYWTGRLRVGQRLRIVNATGRASVAFQGWNALEPSERLNVGDTAKLQWTTRLTTGSLLFSDMGRVLASVLDDNADGRHDLLAGTSDEVTNQLRFGRLGQRHSHGNFLLAAAKLGLSQRDLHPCVNFFSAVRATPEGALEWAGSPRPASSIELRAELPLLFALSNCPHPLDPNPTYDPGEVEVVVMEATAPPSDDFCRTRSEEAERAFENTDAWIAANMEAVR
jgi:urea carboxylase-associated protein 2